MKSNSTLELDSLFSFLYNKGSNYTKYRDIVHEHFGGDEENNDIQGLLIKLDRDDYVDTGSHDSGEKFGWTQQTTYKLSYEGRLLYERSNCGPYAYLVRKEKRKNVWDMVKIFAIVLNAIAVLILTWMAL